MIVRHIIFAGLFATATFANAGTVDASTPTVQPAWTFNAGGTDAEPKAFQSVLAGPGGTWSAHSRMGDIGSSSTLLFAQNGSSFSTAPVTAASTSSSSSSSSQTAAAPEASQAAAAPEASQAAPAPEASQAAFIETKAPAEAAIAAPAAAEMAEIVVAADVIAADAPAALAAIPEPATGMLMLAGLLGAGFMTRRRK